MSRWAHCTLIKEHLILIISALMQMELLMLFRIYLHILFNALTKTNPDEKHTCSRALGSRPCTSGQFGVWSSSSLGLSWCALDPSASSGPLNCSEPERKKGHKYTDIMGIDLLPCFPKSSCNSLHYFSSIHS